MNTIQYKTVQPQGNLGFKKCKYKKQVSFYKQFIPFNVLCFQVAYEREDLVAHPLIQASLNKKWQKFAAYLYYFKLLLYICFLTFLTGYILVTAPLREPYRAKDCTIVQQDADLQMTIFVLLGKYFVIILALLHILFEV